MGVTCGIDWAETHHDVALVDDTGRVMVKGWLTDDLAGYTVLLGLLARARRHP
jgi:hypothetical protein